MLITQSTKLCIHIWCDSKKPSTSPLLMIFSSKESLLVLAELSFFSLDTTSMTGLFILILFLTTTACLKKKYTATACLRYIPYLRLMYISIAGLASVQIKILNRFIIHFYNQERPENAFN